MEFPKWDDVVLGQSIQEFLRGPVRSFQMAVTSKMIWKGRRVGNSNVYIREARRMIMIME